MAYSLKDGQGSLFKNSHKEKDSHPDMRGDCMLDGVVYEISGWSKVTQKGDRFLSLSIKPKQERPSSQRNTYRTRDEDEPPW